MNPEEEWLAPLRAKFAAVLPVHREALLQLHADGDREGLVDLAHKLAGIAGMLGAPEVGGAALLFEESLRADKEAEADLAALLAAIDRAIG